MNLRKVLEVDRRWSARLQLRQGSVLRGLALVVAHTGDSLAWAGIAVLLWYDGQSYLAVAISVTALAIAGLVTLIKVTIRRRRPTSERSLATMTLDQHSFPSGHAARSIGLAIVLGKFIPALAPWLLGWALAVGIARVDLGVHFLSDVMAGWALGMIAGEIVARLL